MLWDASDLRTKQHYKADKRVDIPEAVCDSNEEFYLVVGCFYPCIAKSNSYCVKNACAITSDLSLKFDKGGNSASLSTCNPFV